MRIAEAGNNNSSLSDGPGLNELDGLDLEERKRKRIGLNVTMDLDNKFGALKTDSGLSNTDCTESSSSLLAKLASQASQAL